MRKYSIWAIPLILIVSGLLQFACGTGGATTPDVKYDASYPPRNFQWDVDNKQINLRWDPVPFAVGYRVFISENGVDFKPYSGNPSISQNQILITNLSNGKPYYLGVSAVGSTLNETVKAYPGGAPNATPITPETQITNTVIGYPPAAPKNLQGYTGDRLVHLDWDHNTESDFDYYLVYSARLYDTYLGEFSAFPLVRNNFYDHDDALNGTTYYYYVTATDLEVLESEASNVVHYTPQSAPPLMPANFTALFVAFEGIVLNWDRTYEQDIRAYRIIRYDWTDGAIDPIGDTSVITLQYPDDPIIGTYPPIVDSLITPGSIYEYWVSAMDIEEQFGPPAISAKVQVPK